MRCLVVTFALAGCQCGSSSTSTVTPPAPTATAAPTTVVVRPGLELAVPPATPPLRSPPMDEPAAARLAKLAFPGFTAQVRAVAPTVFEVRQLIDARPKLAATITIKPCFDCLPMTLDAWQARRDALALLVDDRLRDRPDTDLEIGKTQLAGAAAMFTFQAGQLFGPDTNGNPAGTYTDAYALYYNDGVNEIRVVAEYKDDPATSKDAMLSRAPREQLDRLAHAMGELYVHAW